MTRLTLHPHRKLGSSVSCDCVCQNGAWLVDCTDPQCNVVIKYLTGKVKPNYPPPAIPLAVKYDYIGCVNIDDVTDPDDPVIVWMYDSWTGFNPVPALR